jgi:hypothetical protein
VKAVAEGVLGGAVVAGEAEDAAVGGAVVADELAALALAVAICGEIGEPGGVEVVIPDVGIALLA